MKNSGSRKTHQTTLNFYDGDLELIKFIQEFLSVSRNEAIRTAVRAYAVLLQQTAPRKVGRPSAEEQAKHQVGAGADRGGVGGAVSAGDGRNEP